MKNTVIYHSADFDGIFCREIARKFLPDAELIGWDYGDPKIPFPDSGTVYVLDLPVDRVFGFDDFSTNKVTGTGFLLNRVIWIDHHKSSIGTHPTNLPGYRIDGVAACRLAWQWFALDKGTGGHANILPLPKKSQYVEREVIEPLAVRLAGEYDIWDKRDPRAELFQHGLRSCKLSDKLWELILTSESTVDDLLEKGEPIQYAQTQQNESIIKAAGFTIQFEGLTFLACNHARYNSFLFAAGLTPEHDGCFGFAWRDGKWNVSLYHAPGKEHHDLSLIAVKYGGGGHKGACGFRVDKLPFL